MRRGTVSAGFHPGWSGLVPAIRAGRVRPIEIDTWSVHPKAMAREDETIMPHAQKLEDEINRMREDMRGNYIMRLQSGVCTVDPGLILVDMLNAYEKMGDYCYNIAQAVAGIK